MDTCYKAKNRPAFPEDAEELSYKEICKSNQENSTQKVNNTWSLDYCPSKSITQPKIVYPKV